MAVDVSALVRILADRPVSLLERDAGLASGQIARIVERGRVQGDTLDDLCGALGIHESEILA
jgi:DNA-binding Xre family transcriptional regulator